MIRFAYPNVNEENTFLGCGRLAVYPVDSHPDGYNPFNPETWNRADVETIYASLIKEDPDQRKTIYEKKDNPNTEYTGSSLDLAYLLGYINRSRIIKPLISTGDIWCTGCIEGNGPLLKPVVQNTFYYKLKSFLSEENTDILFIVPFGNINDPPIQKLINQKVTIISLSDRIDSNRKNVLQVRPKELKKLIDFIFEKPENIPSDSINYKGLKPFEESDKDDFFGREELIDQIQKKFNSLPHTRWLNIMGPRKSGKTSVIQASFIPWIKEKEKSVKKISPGKNPLNALAEIIASIVYESPTSKDTAHYADKIKTTDNITKNLRKNTNLVIVIDNFEEIYTLCKIQNEQTQFIRNLLYAVNDNDDSISVVSVLCSEYLEKTHIHPELNRIICNSEHTVLVPCMNENELKSVINGPARKVGYIFSDREINRLISEIKGLPNALPLIQQKLYLYKNKGISDKPKSFSLTVITLIILLIFLIGWLFIKNSSDINQLWQNICGSVQI